jgi:hypothetical protein
MRASWTLAVAALAACASGEPDVHPFRIEATMAGAGLETGVTQPTPFVFDGVAHRRDDTTLEVQVGVTAPQLLTISFHRDAAPEVAFPPQLEGQQVNVTVDVDPTRGGPDGEPLPIHGVLIALGAAPNLRFQFFLGEFSSDDTRGLAIQPAAADQDAPWFHVVNDWAQFEPAKCGPVYYDVLQAIGDNEIVPLRRGEKGELSIGAAGEPPWKVLNVMSYHRRGSCGSQAKAWTQMAAWR